MRCSLEVTKVMTKVAVYHFSSFLYELLTIKEEKNLKEGFSYTKLRVKE